MLTRKQLARRSFLRGSGAAIALPFLDAMIPAFAAPNRLANETPKRLAFVYIPNGVIQESWSLDGEGPLGRLSPTLQPLQKHRSDLLMFSGLTHNNARALGDGGGDHARAASSFLTGIHPRKTAGSDIKLGISADQLAANAIGEKTRFASLEFGIEPGRLAGNCDSGYSCAYSNSISWRGEQTPNPPEINPRLAFERMFGGGDEPVDAVTRARRIEEQKSVLDFVSEDAGRLQRTLGPIDRRKIDEYLTSLREVEKRLDKTVASDENVVPPIDKPDGVPARYSDHARVMFDLMAIAFQTDMTRVSTFMMGREGSNLTYPEIEVNRAHHGMSHHRGEPGKVADIAKINRHHVEQFSYFLDKLASVEEADGRLLDNMMVVYGSGIADGNRHTHHDLPVLVAGNGGGTLRSGRHLRYPNETPMTNLYLAMLDRIGVYTETLGDASGKLEHLSNI